MRSRALALAASCLVMLLVSGCGGTATTSPSAGFQLSLSPATVPAGGSSEGTLTLSARARSAVYVSVSSSDAVASVPSSLMLPSGSMSTTFLVTTRLVAADTVARIRASVGDARQEVALQVIAPVAKPPTLDSLELDASVVRGGQNAQGTIRLTGAAPAGGISVSIRSSNSAAIVPATVLIPGGALSATFTISTRPVELETQFEIVAIYGDQLRTRPLRVTP